MLAGCAVTTPQNTPVWQKHQVNPADGEAFWLYVPSTYDKNVPTPLVITCHGSPPFDIAEHHIREMKMLGQTNGCIVVAPELVATDGIIGDGPVSGMLKNERIILSLISHLTYRYNIDRNNVMITGFSGGGFPAYWVGLRHPDVFTAVVARNCNFSKRNLDGWYPPEAVRTPVMIYYGDSDPAPIKWQSQRGIKYLRSKGFDVTTAIVPDSGHERHPHYAMRFFVSRLRPAKPTVPQPQRHARRSGSDLE